MSEFMMRRFAHDPRQYKTKTSIWKLYKKLFLHTWAHWRYLVVAFFSVIAVASLQFVIPQLTQYTIDRIIPEQRYSYLVWIALGVIGAAILLGVFNFLSS